MHTRQCICTVVVTCLNLVIASSCALPVVRNTLDKMKSTVYFFINSPKRESLLMEVAEKEGHPMDKRKVLIDVPDKVGSSPRRLSSFLHCLYLYSEGT